MTMVNTHTWSRSVGIKEMALHVAATLMRLQKTVYLSGVFSSIPWKRLLSLERYTIWQVISIIGKCNNCLKSQRTLLTAACGGRVSLLHGTSPASHKDFQLVPPAFLAPGSTTVTQHCSSHFPHLQEEKSK